MNADKVVAVIQQNESFTRTMLCLSAVFAVTVIRCPPVRHVQ